jgi:flagellar hook-length control protein FliK
LVSAPEKSDPIRAAELTQDRDASKSVSQPNPTNVAETAPAADTSKAHQPADLAQAAELAQLPAERIETSATPAAPLPQPISNDIVLPAGSSTHGFEMPLAHTAAPSAQDVPVRLAFNAPNVPDNSAFDALALKIASHSSDGDSHFSIRLDPPELGKIEVNLSVDAHGHAQAELSADKVQTLELLQKDSSSLERALKDAGLNLPGGLAFSLKGDGRSQAWRDSQNGRSRGVQIATADAASASATMTARAALAAQAYGLPISNLDIRV